MQSWALHAQALAEGDEGKPPREDEFFHSQTSGGRYVSNGAIHCDVHHLHHQEHGGQCLLASISHTPES
jgi:hypothetical protein